MPETVFASYRGLMSDGAPMICMECERGGRHGVKMRYQGLQQVSQILGVAPEDTLNTLPYDVWKCPHGHEYQDGY